MLSVRGKSTGFDRAVYEGFNEALQAARQGAVRVPQRRRDLRRGPARGEGVRRRRSGSASRRESIVGGREDFEAIATGSTQAARALRARVARVQGPRRRRRRHRSALERGPHAHGRARQGPGLRRHRPDDRRVPALARARRAARSSSQEINNLNVIVDHNTGQRAVADLRVRRPAAEPPGVLPGPRRREQDPRAPRPPRQALRDHEAAGRRAAPHRARPRAAPEGRRRGRRRRSARSAEDHQKVLPALLAADVDIDVPARRLSVPPRAHRDAGRRHRRSCSASARRCGCSTSCSSSTTRRCRSASSCRWARPSPPSSRSRGVEASKKVELMQDIHHQYYSRLAPAMQKMAEEAAREFNEERRRALDQLVKTVLLAEVSPRLKQGGLTIERLVQLNSVDVEGETFRGQVRVAETDLAGALATSSPTCRSSSTDKTALVRYVLGRVSLGEVLGRARSQGRQPGASGSRCSGARCKAALGIEGDQGLRATADANDGDWDLEWRRTRRRGRIKLGNVREMSYDDFDAAGRRRSRCSSTIPGTSPGTRSTKIACARPTSARTSGNEHTVCWLPRHMSPDRARRADRARRGALPPVRRGPGGPARDAVAEGHGHGWSTRRHAREKHARRAARGPAQGGLHPSTASSSRCISDVDTSRPHETLAENLEHIADAAHGPALPAAPDVPRRAEEGGPGRGSSSGWSPPGTRRSR